MAKKPYKFTEMSDKKCRICGKLLKKNVVERQPTADTCYAHESSERKSGHAKRERKHTA